MPPNFFGNQNSEQAEIGRLPHDLPRQTRLVVAHRFQVGSYFLGPEFVSRAADGVMLFGEVLGGKDLRGCAILDQKGAASSLRDHHRHSGSSAIMAGPGAAARRCKLACRLSRSLPDAIRSISNLDRNRFAPPKPSQVK